MLIGKSPCEHSILFHIKKHLQTQVLSVWLQRQDLNLRLLGYEPDELPTAPPRDIGGGGRIRTFEGERRQIYSLLPLATREPHHFLEPTIGLEPTTY